MSQQYLKIKGEKVVPAFVKIVQDEDCYSEAHDVWCHVWVFFCLFKGLFYPPVTDENERRGDVGMSRCGVTGEQRLVLVIWQRCGLMASLMGNKQQAEC